MLNYNPCPHAADHGCRHFQPMPPYCGFSWPDCPYLSGCSCNKSDNQDASPCHEQEGDCVINNDLTVGGDFNLNGNAHIKGNLTVDGIVINANQDSNEPGSAVNPDNPQGGIGDANQQNTATGTPEGYQNIVVDSALNPSSTNAISNSAVTNAIETLQNQINDIPVGTDINGSVSVDNVTIASQAGVLRLADNMKDTGNTVGDVQVTGNTLPMTLQDRTRYNIYHDITNGNTTINGVEVIQLPAGSKIVPKGGMPLLPVTGGEVSWVHSSDIGMIQDDETLSTSARQARGEHNAAVLRTLAQSRYHLILDGTYFVYIHGVNDFVTGSAGRANARSAIPLSRVLCIQGGGLNVDRFLFYITAGGGIRCDGVTFNHNEAYPMFGIWPEGGVVDCVEMHNCMFKGKGRFISGWTDNIPSSDYPNLPRIYTRSNCVNFLGLSGSERYKDVVATSTLPNMLYVYPEGETVPSSPSMSGAYCAYPYLTRMYVPQTGGEYVLKIDSNGHYKHMGVRGTFILATELQSDDETDGNAYTILKLRDSMNEQGVIQANTNPPVSRQGVDRFVIENCALRGSAIEFGGMAFYTECRVSNSTFAGISGQGLTFSCVNETEAAKEWASRSVPIIVEDCIFRGMEGVATPSGSYDCAMLAETDTVIFRRNTIENIISTTNTYDVYLSANNVEYTGNTVRNVCPFKPSASSGILYGLGKAKNVSLSMKDIEANADRVSDPAKRLSRIYENNTFCVSIKALRELCGPYIEANMPGRDIDEVLEERVLFTEMQNVVTDWGMEEYVVKNNTFDMPDCKVKAIAMSNKCVVAKRFIIENNWMSFKSFPSTPTYGYQAYMFAMNPLADNSSEVRICGNTFISGTGGELINLLGLNKNYVIGSFHMEDNKFVNCGYRIANRYRHNTMASDYYDGMVQANKLSVRGNEEAPNLDASYIGTSSTKLYSVSWSSGADRSKFGMKGVPVMFRGGDVEVWDSQERGVPANDGKYIILPNDNSVLTVKSRHICRPMPLDSSNKPVYEENKSLGLCWGLPMQKKGFCITIRYCIRGVWKEKKVEMRCVSSNTTTGLGVSVRGVDGRRSLQFESNLTRKYLDLAEIEDLGLKMQLMHLYVYSTTQTANTCTMRLSLYTDSNGTNNDPGSVITIQVTDIALADEIRPNDAIEYGPTSPMSDFIAPGTLMSQEQRNGLLIGDLVLYNKTTNGTTRCTLRPTDAGFWVLDNTTCQMVVWNGSEWLS